MQIGAILWFKVNLENMLEMFTKACCQKYKNAMQSLVVIKNIKIMQIGAILWFKVNLENMLEMFTKACHSSKI